MFKFLEKWIEAGKPAYSLENKPIVSDSYKLRIEGKSDVEFLGTILINSLNYTGDFLVYKDNSLVPSYGPREGIEHRVATLEITAPNNRIAISRGESVSAKYSNGKVFSYNKEKIISG